MIYHPFYYESPGAAWVSAAYDLNDAIIYRSFLVWNPPGTKTIVPPEMWQELHPPQMGQLRA